MNTTKPERKIGLLLGVGIFFAPYIFSWFTLRNGYSKVARTISFAWLVIALGLAGSNAEKGHQKSMQTQEAKEVPANSNAFANQMTKGEYIRKLGVDMPDDQLRHICSLDAMGILGFSNELKDRKFLTDQEFADNILSIRNEVAPKYLPIAELKLKMSHSIYIRKQEFYSRLINEKGLNGAVEVINQVCRQNLRQALGR